MEWNQLLCMERQQKKASMESDYTRASSLAHSAILSEYDEDYLSIISSQAFRRLQDKTQVFPLDKSDFVRTRLTHSMEVSTIASDLARMIYQGARSKIRGDAPKNAGVGRRLSTIVACAGLLHDTGNPPFGHYGEEVLRDWFRRKFHDETFCFRGRPIGKLLSDVDPRMTADFENFEGNAQGLRILSKAGLRQGSHDVNLTFAVMNTLIKYPNPSTDFEHDSPDVKRHKMGYYYAEREIMERICAATGTKVNGQYVRHPLVYIMEAADDIAYATADLADSVKKGRFTVTEFIDFYERESNVVVDREMRAFADAHKDDDALYDKICRYIEIQLLMRAKASVEYAYRDQAELRRLDAERKALFETPEEQEALRELEARKNAAKSARNRLNALRKSIAFARKAEEDEQSRGGSVLRRSLSHSDTPETEFAIFENWLEDMRLWLMNGAVDTFLQNYDAIMAGEFLGELCGGDEIGEALRIMKKAMVVHVYDAQELIALELSAKRIMESLLDDFIRAAMYADEPDEAEHMTSIDDRFVHMIPDNFKMDYLGAKKKIEARVESGKQTRDAADAEELYLRFLMVTDFISGMTDSFARNLYRVTNGME